MGKTEKIQNLQKHKETLHELFIKSKAKQGNSYSGAFYPVLAANITLQIDLVDVLIKNEQN